MSSQSIPLPFGTSGLDRSSGVMAVRPGSLRDARNVALGAGKAEVRRGMVQTASLPSRNGAACTSIPLLEAVRFERVSVAVGYYAATRELHLYRLTGTGESPSHVGPLYTLDESANAPPRLHAAEVGGRLFIAHDEPLQSRRQETYVYDPLGSPAIYPLTAALNAAGEAPIRFRGVLAWSDYLVGWGFASATESRPEVVRVSLPGQPTVFDPEHYFVAGTRGDPVLSCRQAGGHLLAMKASQTFRIHGTSHLDFGILPLHALTGALGHALTAELDGRAFAWSAEGPVALTGSVDPGRLEEPLDLAGPQPEDFQELEYSSGYVQYIPGRRLLEWVFGGVSFVLDLQSGQWSYGQSSVSRASGALLYSGESLADELDEAPTGFPMNVSAAPRATEAVVSWDNSGAVGNETAEVWIQATGGNWTLAAQQVVTEAGSQNVTISGLFAQTTYQVAMRYRRGGRVTPGYEDGQQAAWPATSRSEFTTSLEAPVLEDAVWSRTSISSERIRITFAPADPGVNHQVLRDGVVIATLGPGISSYDDTGITGETAHGYRIRAVLGQHESPTSNILSVYAGPTPGPSDAEYEDRGLACGIEGTAHRVSWTNANDLWHVEVLVDGAGPRLDPGTTVSNTVCVEPGQMISVRHAVESFGTWDFTPDTRAHPAEPIGP